MEQLSNKRRVGLSEFKKLCFINIREYYEKDGKMLPGKKVSLSRFSKIKTNMVERTNANYSIRVFRYPSNNILLFSKRLPVSTRRCEQKAKTSTIQTKWTLKSLASLRTGESPSRTSLISKQPAMKIMMRIKEIVPNLESYKISCVKSPLWASWFNVGVGIYTRAPQAGVSTRAESSWIRGCDLI